MLVAMVRSPLAAGGPGPSGHELADRAAEGLGVHWGSARERHHVSHVGHQADVAGEERWAVGRQAGDGHAQQGRGAQHCHTGTVDPCYSWLKPRVLFLSHCK